jgi:predicted 3-demethylubiquinone-9 3-methyltransferase (glyoxalase superfamily)
MAVPVQAPSPFLTFFPESTTQANTFFCSTIRSSKVAAITRTRRKEEIYRFH